MHFYVFAQKKPAQALVPAWGGIAGLLLLLLAAFPAVAGAAKNKAGKCVAGICLETPGTEKAVVAKYGPGHALVRGAVTAFESATRCYYDPGQDLYIEFDFDKHHAEETVDHADLEQIMVSSVPMCEKSDKPKQPFPKFATEYGLTIGSTEAEVRAAMGTPDRLDDTEVRHEAHYGESAMFYHPDARETLRFNFFYISRGKVKSILVSDSE